MTRTIILSAVLALSTTGAHAMCKGKGHEQAMSCADGTVWDSLTQACVPVVSS